MNKLIVKKKIINYYYFIFINSLFAICIGLLYFFSIWQPVTPLLDLPNYVLMIVFSLSTHTSLIIVFSFIISIIGLPTILLSSTICQFIQAFIAGLSIFCLFLDTQTFHATGGHLTDIISIDNYFSLLNNNQYKILRIILLFMFVVIEFILAVYINKLCLSKQFKQLKVFAFTLVILIVIAQSIYYTGSCLRKNYISKFVSHFPWCNNNTKQNIEIAKFHQLDNNNTIKNLLTGKISNINYPLKPLKITEIKQPKNIIIIGIDGWRADYFDSISCPNLWQFARKGNIFKYHLSGGNGTKPGLFGLFYGIPASYFNSFVEHRQSPVLIDRLLQLNYQFGVFVSTQVERNKLDKTTFNKIYSLRMQSPGETPADWDYNTTKDWLIWYNNRDKSKPFFSFIFYFSAHEHDFPALYKPEYMPTEGKLTYADIIAKQGVANFKKGYQTSIQYLDMLANKVINELSKENVLKDTIVIITGDHGTEINDNQQHLYGHGSNFTDCQLQVPFAIVGDKFNSSISSNKTVKITTHYDFVPTIMKNYLGVTNEIKDYSIGLDLLNEPFNRDWHLATNSNDTSRMFGIITKDYIQQYFPSGKSKMLSKSNKPIFMIEDRNKILPEVVDMITRFLK